MRDDGWGEGRIRSPGSVPWGWTEVNKHGTVKALPSGNYLCPLSVPQGTFCGVSSDFVRLSTFWADGQGILWALGLPLVGTDGREGAVEERIIIRVRVTPLSPASES